jgi:biopolymer transport protein ExbD
MITRPFNFASHLRRFRRGLDLVPFLDVCVIVVFFGLFGSRFILAPGVAIDLQLPESGTAAGDVLPTSRVVTVGEVDGGEMLIFEGRIFDLPKFERFLAERSGSYTGEVLLVRMDRDVSMSLLVRVMEVAKQAGFEQVLLAAESEAAAAPPGGVR